MKSFIIACLVVATAVAQNMDSKWSAFKVKYKVIYKTRAEEASRKVKFVSNMKIIEEHNKRADAGNETYWVKMNAFSDLDENEFTSLKTGFRGFSSMSNLRTEPFRLAMVSAPTSLDWRALGAIPPIKDQLNCGSCWAFSAVSVMESLNFIRTGNMKVLSEQQVVDCASNTKYGNYGCDGGFSNTALQYIIDNGIASQSSYPYNGTQANCKYTKSINVSEVQTTNVSLVRIPSLSESALLNAVIYRPVSVAIYASRSGFMYYSSGVYTDPKCPSRISSLNHAVDCIGFGVTSTGVLYWIVRNSWGTSWGQGGYILMARGKNQCGIATDACYLQ